MDRLNILEGDLEKRLAVVEDMKNVESCVTTDDPLVEKEIQEEVNAEELSASPTELNGESTGDVEVEPMLNESPAASLSGVEEIKEGDRSIFDKIGDLFDLKTDSLKSDLKRDNASLNSALNEINMNIVDVKSDMNDAKSNMNDVKLDMK